MDDRLTVFFAMLRSGVGESATLPPAVSARQAEAVCALAKRHDLLHLVALPLADCLEADNPLVETSRHQQLLALYRSEQLDFALEALCAALEQEEIPYIPLKGAVLRQWYPQPWMRTSCDVDILVHKADIPRATACLTEKLGYQRLRETGYDISFSHAGGVHVELHYSLLGEERTGATADVLSRVWEIAQPVEEGCFRYAMPDALFYFYHIAHMAKHVENGGCGMRPFLDMHILEQQPHNRDAREQLLRQGGLVPFETVCRELMVCWFAGREPSGLARQLQTYILTGGVYGSYEQQTAARQGRAGGKGRYTLTRIFPSLQALRHDFPVLQRHPWLLPGCWLWRLVRLPFGGRWRRTATELQTDRSAAEDVAVLLDSLGL